MNFIGTKYLKTERLELRPQTINEQKRLWEILMLPEINSTYLTMPKKFAERLKDWDIQEPMYLKKVLKANDSDVFEWSIFYKENNKCIGKIGFHEANKEFEEINNQSIRGLGWYIDPAYQGNGFAFEAAKVALKYMFNDVCISEVRTSTGKTNIKSRVTLEKLGFINKNKVIYVEHTYVDEPSENIIYGITKDEYNKLIEVE